MASFPKIPSSDLWRMATTLRTLSDVFEQLPSSRPWWAGHISSDLFLHGSLILTQSLSYYHGNISQGIRLNKLFFFPPLASVYPLPWPSLSPVPSHPAPISLPAPEPITRPPRGPGLHNRVSSRPSYSSRIA